MPIFDFIGIQEWKLHKNTLSLVVEGITNRRKIHDYNKKGNDLNYINNSEN